MKLRKDGYSWRIISNQIDIGVNSLRNRAIHRGIPTDPNKRSKNINKKMCYSCRKYFYREDLRSNAIGRFCDECYKKRFGEESRYEKDRLGLPYD